MLVLSRKKNESVVINDCITVVIVDIRGDKVRLGIEAPKEVSVFRKEIYDSIQRESVKTNSSLPKEKNRKKELISHEIQTTNEILFSTDSMEHSSWNAIEPKSQEDEESVVSNILEITQTASSVKRAKTPRNSSATSAKKASSDNKTKISRIKKAKKIDQDFLLSNEITVPVLISETSTSEIAIKTDSSPSS